VVALEGVDFDLRRGEVHVLFGENGAGKSTLINIISGTYPPDTGSFKYQGKRSPI
jgi:ribose transport system ATP-binding protein